jgi:TrmH family RNA methyltransferase
LVATSHPGNIGATARAMKTMGLDELHLVAPEQFPHPQASAMAAGADDILEHACVHADLPAALAGCHWVAGLSARPRYISGPTLSARDGAEAVAQRPTENSAFVFGRERTGLTNAELDLCHVRIHIPANPSYSSLNLAAAVQIMAYEWRMASSGFDAAPTGASETLASAAMLGSFYEHLEEVLAEIGFLDRGNPRQLMRRLRRLFNRAQMEPDEVNILRGMLSAIQGGRTRRPGGVNGRDV